MNKYMPRELENLSESKERIMRIVVSQIEEPTVKSKNNWRVRIATVTVAAAILFLSFTFFTNNEGLIGTNSPLVNLKEKLGLEIPLAEKDSLAVSKPDETKENKKRLKTPELVERGKSFYLNGISLRSTKEDVIAEFGSDYELEEVDSYGGWSMDFVMHYDEVLVLLFNEKVQALSIENIDESYGKSLFESYKGNRYVTSDFDEVSRKGKRLFYIFHNEEVAEEVTLVFNENGKLSIGLSTRFENFNDVIERGDIIKVKD